jgi:mono/diheme cytochrome c family protein
MRREVIWAALLLLGISTLLPSNAKKNASRAVDGKQVFEQHCASCHAGGGNRVHPHRPVAGSKQLATIAVFKGYLSEPPGHMPFYADVVNDEATLKALYDYCRTLKVTPTKEASADVGPSLAVSRSD